MEGRIRTARTEDAGEIREIYAHYVRETAITFAYTVPSLEETRCQVERTLKKYPYLVVETKKGVRGFAYAHPFHEREAFGWAAELSIYLHPMETGRGWGKALYALLLQDLKAQRVCIVYGVVASPNPDSEHLHESMGFIKAGMYHKVGYKLGKWWDVSLYEHALCERPDSPAPLLPPQLHV